MKLLLDQFKVARITGTPILAISSPDQLSCMAAIVAALPSGPASACVRWDCATGLTPINEAGKQALKETKLSEQDLTIAGTEPAVALAMILKLRARVIVFALNLARSFREGSASANIQSVANLRDPFKGDGRTLVILGPDIDLPAELRHDIIMLEDPLPNDEQYGFIIEQLYEAAGVAKPDTELIREATLTVRGLPEVEAEQVLSMSLADPKTGKLSKKGFDLSSAWELKRAAIAKVKGLTMTIDGPPLDQLRGMDSLITTLKDFAEGPLAPLVWVRVDEVEKMFAGLGQNGGPGDNTGITQDLLQQFLVTMEDYGWTGYIYVGLRGTGKTAITKSIGAAYKTPTISIDAGGMRAKHVGESEGAIREAFRTVRSIGGSRVCVLATCNNINVLPPELLRRFKFGVYYFDVLTKPERDALWPVYLKEWKLPADSERPYDEGWTGSEIRNCCEIAYGLKRSIKEAAKKIIPVTESAPADVERLRKAANGNWLSASYEGKFALNEPAVAQATGRRRLQVEA